MCNLSKRKTVFTTVKFKFYDKMKLKKLVLGVVSVIFTGFASNAQLVVDNSTMTPEQLVQNVLVGTGVTVSNVTFNGQVTLAQNIQTQVGYFDATGITFPLPEGILLGSGDVQLAVGPNATQSPGGATNNNGVGVDPNDPDIEAVLAPFGANNEAILEFDFVPNGDSVVFNYIFASEEYHFYSTSNFNDGFGFFISGPGFAGPYQNGAENIALIPGGSLPVTMNNLNNGSSNTGPCNNCAYLIDNTNGQDIEYNAHTVSLQAAAQVICGETYHIKIAIADAGDQALDSGVFLEANSFSSNGVNVQIASATGSAAITEACDSAIVTFIRPSDETGTILSINYGVGGTATNGVDYPTLPGNVTFGVGEDSVQFYITPNGDGIPEGTETIELSVEIINSCGDTIITTATIEIIDPLPYNVLTTDVNIDCATPTVDVTATTDGGVPTLTYDWGIYGTGATVQVPGDVAGTTTYNVSVTDACGQVQNGSVDVTLTPAPQPTINFNQNTFTICPGEVAAIDATVSNPYDPGQLTYDWQPTGETTEDISVNPTVLTWYYLTIFDGCYNVTDSVKVEIGTLDLTSIVVVPASDCAGQGGTPGTITVNPNIATYTYTLIGGGNTYGPQNSGVFNGLDGGITYFLNVLSDDGCQIDTAVNVPLGQNPVTATWVVDSLRHVTCAGDNDGGAYIMNVAGGSAGAPYNVTWTHTSGLHDQETLNSAGQDSEQDNLFGGQWVVTVTDGDGCAWSQLFTIDEPDYLTLDFTFNDPTCFGFNDGSVQVNTSGGNGGNIITITNSAGTNLNGGSDAANQLVEGWYYATITDSEGCFIQDSVLLDDPGELGVDLTVTQPLCYGIASGSAQVTAVNNATGDPANVGFYWNPNPSGLPNGIGANFNNHMGEGTYVLTINDENGCSNQVEFTIVYPPKLIFAPGNGLGTEPAYCREFSYQNGNGVVYAAAAGGTPDYTYTWTNLATGATSNNTTWAPLNPGQYSIVVFDGNGCMLADTITLDSLNPQASFEMTSDQFLNPSVFEGTAEVCIEFTNTSLYYANPNNPNADTTFYWNLDTANNSSWYVSHDINDLIDTCFTTSGEYVACVVATNKNNCLDTVCHTIIVYDPLIFTPVNVFTPNGDGDNDVFTFRHLSQAVETFSCTIVNRWGVVVHEMTDISDEWNGTDKNGSPCVNGVYFYTYEGVSTDGTELKGQGNVTIIGDK